MSGKGYECSEAMSTGYDYEVTRGSDWCRIQTRGKTRIQIAKDVDMVQDRGARTLPVMIEKSAKTSL